MSSNNTRRPKVLMLGNGLNRLYNGDSWGNLLDKITTDERIKEYIKKVDPENNELNRCPMPLQAIARTGDSIDTELKKIQKDLYGEVTSEEHRALLKQLLDIGFDHILTTNYSYELECVALNKERITSDSSLKKHRSHTNAVNRADKKYNIYTYYEFENSGKRNKIWHIHGEARKPSGMILGHYYYGMLLKRYFEIFDKRRNKYADYQKGEKEVPIESWLDAFVLGDVYVLGLGYDLSEFDLWWLLNRKKQEKADVGTFYYYEMTDSDKEIDTKILLLEALGAHCDSLGIEKDKDNNEALYRKFYKAAIMGIAKKAS